MSRTHGSAAGPAPQHTNAQHNAHAQLSIEHVYYRRADACGEGGFGDSLGQTQPNGRAVPMRPSKLHRNPFSRHQGREPLALFRRRATRHGPPGPVRPDLSSTAISRTCMTPARPCAAMLAIVGAAQGQPHGRFCASCATKLRPHARNPMLYPLGPHTRAMETPRTTRHRCLAFSRTRQSFRNAWACRPATMAEEAIWIHGRGPLWPT